MEVNSVQLQDSANPIDVKKTRRVGRPRVSDRPGFDMRYTAILERLGADSISKRQAARELNIGYATLKRFLDARKEPDTVLLSQGAKLVKPITRFESIEGGTK